VRTDGADRVKDPWEQLLAPRDPGADADVDEELEAALLSYKQRRAAAWGAERFAAELRRRDEAEGQRQVWTSEALAAPVEASVEKHVVEGEPATFRPEPPRIGFDPSFVVTPAPPATADVVPDVVPEVVEEPVAVAPDVEPVAHEEIVPVDEAPLEEVPVAEVPVAEVPVAPAVAVPRFSPDQVWSAGSPSKRLPAALRHPHVPRPPTADPMPHAEPKRRWRGKRGQPEPVHATAISAPEWARMSPGARRLYGFEESPEERRAG
jgi:hypothetical protein